MLDAITAWDLSLLDTIAGWRTAWLDAFFSCITHLGDAGIVWIVLALVLLCRRSTRRTGLCVACALILDLIFCNLLIKPLVNRPRPFALRAMELLIAPPADASFPSGHTAASMASVAALWYRRSRLRWPALALAVVIACSRLYLTVHYPTDVLAGAVVGVACGLGGAALVSWFLRRKENPHAAV